MSNLSGVSVLILAGGLGTRLRTPVNDKPKVLADVNHHPFLEYLLLQLNNSGFKNIIICTGYLGDQIEKKFGKIYDNLSLFYSREPSPLGTGGALRLALPLSSSKHVLVMNGDSFCDVNLEDFWKFHISRQSKASLVLSYLSDASRYGLIELNSNERIISFSEKKKGNVSGWVNAGIYLVDKLLISQIPEGRAISLEKELFPKWLNQSMYGYKSKRNFIDIGTPESYSKVEQFLEKSKFLRD